MHVTGIVAEYNPFHNGHLYQLTECKKTTHADFVIAVMSGNFTQRGVPSLSDKFIRTQMALMSGIDVVLELPVPFATASAERFCEAAISILNKTGVVNTLSFGSEIGEISTLYKIAEVLTNEPPQLSHDIRNYLKQGMSFPRAREMALAHYLSLDPHLTEDISLALGHPNNILGIEYIKALLKYDSPIYPVTVKRKDAHYHDRDIKTSIASATAIRTQLKQENVESVKSCMPAKNFELLVHQLKHIPTLDDLSDFLQYKLIFSNKEDLYSLWDIPEELTHSILNTFTKTLSISAIIKEVTSKTYTRATVQRALFRIILNVLQNDMQALQSIDWIPYIRVLGCKKSATPLLAQITKTASVPIITNVNKSYPLLDACGKTLLDYELKASHIYHYLLKNPHLYTQDFTQSFIKL